MECGQCGETNATGAEVCGKCGAPLSAPETETPTLLSPVPAPRRRANPVRTGILVIFLLALVAGGVGAYQYWYGVPVLESMIPDGAIGYGCGDARWLWDNTADVRAEPKVAKGIADAEKQLGFGFEKDVVPWAGSVAVAVLDANAEGANAAVYVQVKDQKRFQETAERVLAEAEKKTRTTWGSTTYKGVPVRTTNLQMGMGAPTKISSFWTKGWIVVAVGPNAADRVIDTWQKTTPSLAKNRNWAKALGQLPASRIAWFGMDAGALKKVQAPGVMQMGLVGKTDAISVGSVSEKADGFRMDSYSMPTSDETAAMYKDLASKIKPVSGDLYSRLPDGSFTTLMVSTPGAWVDYLKKTLLESAPSPDVRQGMEHGFAEMAGIEIALKRIKSDAAGTIAWQPDKGFGGAFIADMGTEAEARAASKDILGFAVRNNARVKTLPGGRYVLDIPPTNEPRFRVQPTWETSGKYFAFATHPMWLKPGTAADRPQLPAQAKGACMIMQGDFRPLEPVVTDLSKTAPPRDRQMATGIAQDTHLSKAQWVTWSTFEADGSTRGVAEISGWQWRDATKALVKRVHDAVAKQ